MWGVKPQLGSERAEKLQAYIFLSAHNKYAREVRNCSRRHVDQHSIIFTSSRNTQKYDSAAISSDCHNKNDDTPSTLSNHGKHRNKISPSQFAIQGNMKHAMQILEGS